MTEFTDKTTRVNLSNKLNLPRPIALALGQTTYDAGGSWRTVTELIAPPQMVYLKRHFPEKIKEDVADRIHTFQGEVVHAVVERAAKTLVNEGWESERRVFAEIRGKKISGQFDLFHTPSGELLDVKYSTAWKAKKNKCPDEWEEQLNCLAALLRLEGRAVSKAGIILFIRDFSKLEAARSEDYPRLPVVYLPSPVWEEKEALLFLEDRVRLHELAETNRGATCSAEERWAKPDIWAIKKRGASRAIGGGLYAEEGAAKRALYGMENSHEIEHRRGEFTHCKHYCLVRDFCPQNKGERATF